MASDTQEKEELVSPSRWILAALALLLLVCSLDLFFDIDVPGINDDAWGDGPEVPPRIDTLPGPTPALFALRAELERERAFVVQEQVVLARERIGEFQSAFAVVRGDVFLGLGALGRDLHHETLRDRGELIFYDGVKDVERSRARGEVTLFLSHQWLGFEDPDPCGVHYAAMCSAVKAVSAKSLAPPRDLRVWVDIVSIPQRNRSSQRLAIASLATFASSTDYFVVVAPPARHSGTGKLCDRATFRSRAWCRAEVMSCWARRGAASMFVFSNNGLEPFKTSGKEFLESLDVFDGDLTCCALGHPDRQPCDREEMLQPMLGLFAEIYKHRRVGPCRLSRAASTGLRCVPCDPDDGETKDAPDDEEPPAVLAEQRTPWTPRATPPSDSYSVIEPLLEKLYPRTFEWVAEDSDGRVVEEIPLFGDLIDAAKYYVDLGDEPPPARPPDFAPGSNARRRTPNPHAKHGRRWSSRQSSTRTTRSGSLDTTTTHGSAHGTSRTSPFPSVRTFMRSASTVSARPPRPHGTPSQ
mmetsp:Transcript_27442/g.82077  ORF Transcript_27442/g.82077 Transcript_27442/m.82077 type:complete len:525 (+) Transcript_27442:99-1673(+)